MGRRGGCDWAARVVWNVAAMPPDVQQLKEGAPLRAVVSDLCLCIRNLVASKAAAQLKVVEMGVVPILINFLADSGAPPRPRA